MGKVSKIQWTSGSWTPWTPIRARHLITGKVGWHCEHVSEGCRNCYSEAQNHWTGTKLGFAPVSKRNVEIFLDEKMMGLPLKWKKPQMVFVCSMTDLFADFVTDEWIDKMFAVMALCPQHTFQCLTKRAERMYRYFTEREREISKTAVESVLELASKLLGPSEFEKRMDARREWAATTDALPQIWLGVSCEDQKAADERIPWLLKTPMSAVRFVSYEPALAPINFCAVPDEKTRPAHFSARYTPLGDLDWIIVGGESGPHARPFDIQWARDVIQQCRESGSKVFVKQLGSKPVRHLPNDLPSPYRPLELRDRKGGSMEEWPPDLRVRELPTIPCSGALSLWRMPDDVIEAVNQQL